MKNEAYVRGKVLTDPVFDHKNKDIEYFKFIVSIKRRSKTCDEIPVMVSKTKLEDAGIKKGDNIFVFGEYRSYTTEESKLLLFVFCKEISAWNEEVMDNFVSLEGYLCQKGKVRVTPKGRVILDLMIAVNRDHGKSSYIPCIVWNVTEEQAEELAIGDKIAVNGRIQSREYEKYQENGEKVTKTTYEVSIKEYFKIK